MRRRDRARCTPARAVSVVTEPQPTLFPRRVDVDAAPPRRLTCGYRLDGLTEPRCPECGRLSDPADSGTYTRHPGFLF